MADTTASTALGSSSTTTADVPGQPFYEKTVKHLRDQIRAKAAIERKLQMLEESIYKKETEYLEDTPHGNIITGFEGYTKGTGAAGAGRRRGGVVDNNRVFSRSSVSFGNAESPMASAQSTPVQAVPTPISSTFQKAEMSAQNTPTSATSLNRAAGGKKFKRPAGEESDGEKDLKKARTGSVMSRK